MKLGTFLGYEMQRNHILPNLLGMRYFAYLAAKFAVAGALLYGLLRLIDGFWLAEEDPPLIAPLRDASRILAFDLVILAWFLLCAGTVALIIFDQRRRCRVCLRRLRMPVERGSWSRMFLVGQPRLEYICPYGHGTLTQEESHLTGTAPPVWRASQGFWEDLFASSAAERRKP